MSFLCYGSDANAYNEVTMLVSGNSKVEATEAFEKLYTHLLGRHGVTVAMGGHGVDPDTTYGIRGFVNIDDVSAELSANLNMYHVDDLKTVPKLLFPADLVVLVYAGKEAKGLGNLPQLQEKLKSRKHRVKLPDMVLLRLDEVLSSPKNVSRGGCCCGCFGTSIYNEDEEDKGEIWYARNLIKACGKLWPRCPVKEDSGPNDDGCED
jgi:hypothetical protein